MRWAIPMGGMADYWDLIDREPRLAGVSIWDWVDQGIAQLTDDGTRWWAYGGDFGDEPNDRNFNCNGLVDADRTPHPALAHVAWAYQPVKATAVNVGNRSVAVRNRYSFTSLARVTGQWKLIVAGVVVAAGHIDVPDVRPGESGNGELVGFGAPAIDSPASLEVTFASSSGRQLGFTRLPMPIGRPAIVRDEPARSPASYGARVEVHADGSAVLTGGTSTLRLDQTGLPCGFGRGDDAITIDWARFGVRRHPTDNDAATFGDEMLMSRYRRSGLADAEPHAVGPPRSGLSIDGFPYVSYRLDLTDSVRIIVRWQVADDGDFALDLRCNLGLDNPPLLRLGLEMQPVLADPLLRWCGPGPDESYPDRVGHLPLGQWAEAPGGSFFDYARPQESGNHTSVEWTALVGSAPFGLVAKGDPTLNTQLLRGRADHLANTRHPHEIEWTGRPVWRLDVAHAGLGTASCGPGTTRRFQLAGPMVRGRLVLRFLDVDHCTPDGIAEHAARSSVLAERRRWLH
ncbi:MAG: glycoside hydrolase family 2 TIM barrel-domain containing protein [Acidimicrobiales bacterium]